MPDAFDVKRAMDAAEAAAKDGDFVAAERHLREVLRLQTAAVGPKHPDVASTLHNLAVVAERAGRIADAEELYRRAFQIASAALPPTHALVARCREDLDGFLEARVVPLRGPGMEQAVAAARATDVRESAAPASSRGAVVAVVALLAVAGGGAFYLLRGSADTGPPPPSTDAVAPGAEAPATAAPPPIESPPPPAVDSESAPPATTTAAPAAAEPALPPPVVAATPDPGAASPAATAPPAAAVPAPAREAPAGDAPSRTAGDPPASSGGVSVVLARVCRDLITRGAWTCVPPESPMAPGRVHFYTRIATPRPAQFVHRWWHGDRLVQARTLRISASGREGYRTYSRQTIEPARRGEWRVELVGEDGRVLAEERFSVQ